MKVIILVALLCAVSVVSGIENINVIGCTGTGSSCTTVGEIADVNFDASLSPSTSWQTIGSVTAGGFATVNNLLTGVTYEFRNCRGGDPSSQATLTITDLSGSVIVAAGTCNSCGNSVQRSWVVYTQANRDIRVINCGSSQQPVLLELRIQPCTVCAITSTPATFDTGNDQYTLSAVDIGSLLVTVGQTCSALTPNNAVPNTFSCSQYEIPQNITIRSTTSTGSFSSSCPNRVLIHDNVPPSIICPDTQVAIPTKSCTTSITGGTPQNENLVVTMCTPTASDFPFADFSDACKGDPRFGLVTPITVNNPSEMSETNVNVYSVAYAQTIMDGTAYNFPAPCASIRLSVLVVVLPRTGTTITKGINYYVAWASSIEYADLGNNVREETEFRIYLQEANPSPGELPQIVNLQELARKTIKEERVSVSQFNISPATPLFAKQYLLIVQGRNSGTNSVSNPVITIN